MTSRARRLRTFATLVTLAVVAAGYGEACSGDETSGLPGATTTSGDSTGPTAGGGADASGSGPSGNGGAGGGGAGSAGAGGATKPCTTRITYGSAWLHPANHPSNVDVVDGLVTWDGACGLDGANSVATLSNGWKPYFVGHDDCAIALDHEGDCAGVPSGCTTRVGYGSSWHPPPDHPAAYDDVAGAVFGDGTCRGVGGQGHAMRLSNGWDPYFDGGCELSFRWLECGGLYENPVFGESCPDPGVYLEAGTYHLVCTTADAGGLYPIRVSKDLVHWELKGHVFAKGSAPTWAVADFWAPEIHKVGKGYVAVFSARHKSGKLAVGVASGPTPLGPFTDLGAPLVQSATMSHIDAHVFDDGAGASYLAWKDDGNAFGKPTPIWGQQLAPDGLALVGQKAQLVTNDLGWEGNLVEGPWVTRHGGAYYLFYSANAFYNEKYAVGVARATSPLGPYVKHGDPILVTSGAFAGPGHGSVVAGPHGDDVFVYHAWQANHVGEAPGRIVLVDRVQWPGTWPTLVGAPSSRSRPLP